MSRERARRLRHLENRNKEPHWLYFLPLMLVLGFVPLIVRARVTPLTEMEQFIFQGRQAHIDVFHYYKSVVFVVLTVLSGLSFAHLNYLGVRLIDKRRWMIPLAIYGVLVLISFLNSDDFVVGWRGFATSYQGLPVYLSYGALIFIIFHMVKTRRDVMLFFWPLWIMSLLMGVISASQYFARAQFDEHPYFGPIQSIFDYEWFRNLLIPSHLEVIEESLRIRGAVFGTLYNSNFAGSFGVMLMFIALAFAFISPKIWQKLLMTLLIPIGVFITVTSNSRAGFIGLVAAGGVWVMFGLSHFFRRHKLYPFVVLSLLAGTLYLLDDISEGRYRERITAIPESIQRNDQVQILEINLDGFDAEIVTEEAHVIMRWVGSQFLFYDDEDNILPFNIEGNSYRLTGEEFESFSFVFRPDLGRVRASFHGRRLDFYLTEDGFALWGVGGLQTSTDRAERLDWLRGYERVFTYRLYNFSVSIPLVRSTWLIGAGTDHFVFTFPQRDIAGRLNGWNLTETLDKAHNMYLQFAIEIGLIGAIAFFSLLFWPLGKLIKGWFLSMPHAMFYVSLFAGVIGMLASGIANDLIMSIAPLFIIIFGLLMTELKEE